MRILMNCPWWICAMTAFGLLYASTTARVDGVVALLLASHGILWCFLAGERYAAKPKFYEKILLPAEIEFLLYTAGHVVKNYNCGIQHIVATLVPTGECRDIGLIPHDILKEATRKASVINRAEGFKIGSYYEHASGGKLHILFPAMTTLHGETLVAETAGDYRESLIAVGSDAAAMENWTEINRGRWMESFK